MLLLCLQLPDRFCLDRTDGRTGGLMDGPRSEEETWLPCSLACLPNLGLYATRSLLYASFYAAPAHG